MPRIVDYIRNPPEDPLGKRTPGSPDPSPSGQPPGVSAPQSGVEPEPIQAPDASSLSAEGTGPEVLARLHDAAVSILRRIEAAIRAGTPPDVAPLEGFVLQVVRVLKLRGCEMPVRIDSRDPYPLVNLAMGGLVAIRIGVGLGWDDVRLSELGLAAFLHDVGMFRIPAEIVLAPRPLTEAEKVRVREHPLLGFELLRPLEERYPWLPRVCLQEHEREDGSGYPSGANGDRVHEYAKVIAIADTFEALVHGRPYEEPLAPHAAARRILDHAFSARFSKRHLAAFLCEVTPFPVGTDVRLSSGEKGRVVRTSPHSPLAPVVRIEGPEGPADRDLSRDPVTFVQRPLDEGGDRG